MNPFSRNLQNSVRRTVRWTSAAVRYILWYTVNRSEDATDGTKIKLRTPITMFSACSKKQARTVLAQHDSVHDSDFLVCVQQDVTLLSFALHHYQSISSPLSESLSPRCRVCTTVTLRLPHKSLSSHTMQSVHISPLTIRIPHALILIKTLQQRGSLVGGGHGGVASEEEEEEEEGQFV